MEVADLLTTMRDLDDVMAQYEGVGVTVDQFKRAPHGFWVWEPPDAETWERAYAVHAARSPTNEILEMPPQPREIPRIRIGGF